jgi:protein TonB
MGFKGVTTISFHVEPDGSVKDVVVTKSSGFDALDQVAAECATQWQYKPAMRNGQPIEVSWHANVQWNLASRAGR